MTRMRIALPATTAIASLLGAALPAFAQAPAPAPMYAPAPAPAPMYAPAPAPVAEPAAVMPVAPVVAPMAADDMTGSLGFGTGVISGTSLATIDGTLFMKYWLSDAMSIVPRLSLTMAKVKDVDATWGFEPSVLINFVLLKGASTRLDAGLGLGISLAKNQPPAAAGVDDTYIGLFVPVQMGVEHFFTRWFSMGIATGFSFISFAKQGDPWAMNLEISNVNYLGSLTFYTD
jgi:hypothetical protein